MRDLVPAAVLLIVLAIPAGAQTTTYTYTSASFTSARAPYSVGGQVTGTFTTANPVAAFLPYTDISGSLQSFSFSDGLVTRTNANSFVCSFQVATDGAGNVTQWDVVLRKTPCTSGNPQHLISLRGPPGPPGPFPGGDFVQISDAGVAPSDPIVLPADAKTSAKGTWTDTNPLKSHPTTYTYIGGPLTKTIGPFAIGDRITGTFRTANPLPASRVMNMEPILESFTFTSGAATVTLEGTYVCGFAVGTDSAGSITTWQISLRSLTSSPFSDVFIMRDPETVDEGYDFVLSTVGGAVPCHFLVLTGRSSETPGTWLSAAALGRTVPALDGLGLVVVTAILAAIALVTLRR